MAFFLNKKKPKEEESGIDQETNKSMAPDEKNSVTRGPDGRFLSKKKTSLPKEKKKKAKKKKTTKKAPAIRYVTTFYGHDVERFYKNKKWYFNVENCLSVASWDTNKPNMPEGDPEKLEEIVKEKSVKFEHTKEDGEKVSVKCMDVEGILELLPFARGIFPGSFRRWLTEVSQNSPPPKPPKVDKANATTRIAYPSDTGY